MSYVTGNTLIKVGYEIDNINKYLPISIIPEILKNKKLFTYTFEKGFGFRPVEILESKQVGTFDLVRVSFKLIPEDKVEELICSPFSRILLGNGEVTKARGLKEGDILLAYSSYYAKVISVENLELKGYVYSLISLGNNCNLGSEIFIKLWEE